MKKTHKGVTIEEVQRTASPKQATDEIIMRAEMSRELDVEEIKRDPKRNYANSEDHTAQRTIERSGIDRRRVFEEMKEEIEKLRDLGYR